jgi:hypothetical protein
MEFKPIPYSSFVDADLPTKPLPQSESGAWANATAIPSQAQNYHIHLHYI